VHCGTGIWLSRRIAAGRRHVWLCQSLPIPPPPMAAHRAKSRGSRPRRAYSRERRTVRRRRRALLGIVCRVRTVIILTRGTDGSQTLWWREMDSNFQFRAGSAPFRRSERSEHGIWAQGAQWLTGAPIYPLSNEALLPERTGCRDRFGAGRRVNPALRGYLSHAATREIPPPTTRIVGRLPQGL
jgi:hypothetical protein